MSNTHATNNDAAKNSTGNDPHKRNIFRRTRVALEWLARPGKFQRTGMRIDRYLERKRVLKPLKYAIKNDNEKAEERYKQALSLFASLDLEQKEAVLEKVGKLFRGYSYFPAESEHKSRAVTELADFFSMISGHLPRNEQGEITSDRLYFIMKDVIEDLKDVVENEDPEGEKPAFADVRIACLNALWELEYGIIEFWYEQLLDPRTNQFPIQKMLDHPPAENFEEHGWSILRSQIAQIGMEIAENPSPKKIDFFIRMFEDADPEVVKYALWSAIYLKDIPQRLIEAARAVPKTHDELVRIKDLEVVFPGSRNESHDELRREARDFLQIAELANLLDKESRYSVALQLALLCQEGKYHLSPLLKHTGDRLAIELGHPEGETDEEKGIQQKGAQMVLSVLGQMNIDVNIQPAIDGLLEREGETGQDILKENFRDVSAIVAKSESPHRDAFLKEMAMDGEMDIALHAFAAALNVPSLHEEFSVLAYEILDDENKAPLEGHMHEFLHTTYKIMLTPEEPQAAEDAAPGTVFFNNGKEKQHENAEKLRTMVENENPHKIFHGLLAAPHLEDIPVDLMERACDILADEEQQGLWDAAQNFMQIAQAKLAQNDSKKTIKSMIKSDNPRMVHYGFAAAAGHEEIPEEFVDSAKALLRLNDETNHQAADNFLYHDAIKLAQSDLPGKEEVIAGMVSSDDSRSVRHGLAAALYLEKIPEDVLVLVQGIKNDTERSELHVSADDFAAALEAKERLNTVAEQFQAAEDLIELSFSGRGYLVPMLVNVGEEMADVLRNPAGKTEKDWQEQQDGAANVLKTLTELGVHVPAVEGLAMEVSNVLHHSQDEEEKNEALEIAMRLAIAGIETPGVNMNLNFVQAPPEDEARGSISGASETEESDTASGEIPDGASADAIIAEAEEALMELISEIPAAELPPELQGMQDTDEDNPSGDEATQEGTATENQASDQDPPTVLEEAMGLAQLPNLFKLGKERGI
jgi:hypothetical protein